MKTIYKYTLPVQDYAVVRIPEGHQTLSVALQHDQICVWALVDTSEAPRGVAFRIAGTGHPLGDADGWIFRGTVLMMNGTLVFHVFEDVPK